MNNDGTNRQRLTAHDGSHSDGPAWSPDGTQIAYTRGRRNDDGHWFSHIYVVNADGTGRTKVSKGDVWDAQPSWSTDGTRIAFGRRSGEERDEDGNFTNPTQRIVVIDADGTGLATLTTGHGWYGSPAWSPHSNRIAYIDTEGAIWLIDADGTNAERVIVDAFWGGGLSWSPDGRRIAFSRGDWTETSIVIADLDRPREQLVTGLGGFSALPKWSPDGDRIAFTRYPEGRLSATRSAYVTGASGSPTGLGTDCRPRGVGHHVTVGFPLPAGLLPSTGTLRVAVLFMDFPDAQATHTTQEEAALGLPYAEAYMEAASYGKLDVEFVPHHAWLRADQRLGHYATFTTVTNQTSIWSTANLEAVALADAQVDFSDVDVTLTVFPSSHFVSGISLGTSVRQTETPSPWQASATRYALHPATRSSGVTPQHTNWFTNSGSSIISRTTSACTTRRAPFRPGGPGSTLGGGSC